MKEVLSKKATNAFVKAADQVDIRGGKVTLMIAVKHGLIPMTLSLGDWKLFLKSAGRRGIDGPELR